MKNKEEKIKPNSNDIFKKLKKISKRFNLLFFFILVVACVAGAILLVNSSLQPKSLDPNYTSPASTDAIDQDTLGELNLLHTSSQGAPAATLPAGRTNPFNE